MILFRLRKPTSPWRGEESTQHVWPIWPKFQPQYWKRCQQKSRRHDKTLVEKFGLYMLRNSRHGAIFLQRVSAKNLQHLITDFSFFIIYQTLRKGETSKNLYNLHIFFNVPHLVFAFLPVAETGEVSRKNLTRAGNTAPQTPSPLRNRPSVVLYIEGKQVGGELCVGLSVLQAMCC